MKILLSYWATIRTSLFTLYDQLAVVYKGFFAPASWLNTGNVPSLFWSYWRLCDTQLHPHTLCAFWCVQGSVLFLLYRKFLTGCGIKRIFLRDCGIGHPLSGPPFSILIWNSKKNRGSSTFFAHFADMRRRMPVARGPYLLKWKIKSLLLPSLKNCPIFF